jgi:hypothetical protein
MAKCAGVCAHVWQARLWSRLAPQTVSHGCLDLFLAVHCCCEWARAGTQGSEIHNT